MSFNTGRRRAGAAVGLLCASAFSAAAQTSVPRASKPPTSPSSAKTVPPMQAPKTYTYNLLRNGSPIGKHTMTIDQANGSVTIDQATDIEVKVVFVTAYKMHTQSHEVWNADKFATFGSQTDDNGTKHKVDATVDAKGAVTVVADGRRESLPVGALPSSFWTEQMMSAQHKAFFDPEKGTPQTLDITSVGHEPIKIAGQPFDSTHYHVAGTIERDVWFANGVPVRLQLKGSDGSTIVSELLPEPGVR